MRRAAIAACLLLVSVIHARAQRPLPAPSEGTSSAEFLPRGQFYLSADALHVEDPRYTWDTHFGGDVDFVDYVVGRLNGIADYEAILGNEFRLFDPNQGNYTLEVSASGRVKKTEIAGVFHHESRHLSDRFKRFPIAWNVLGFRVLRRFEIPNATLDVQGGAGTVTEHAYVDYGWTTDLDIVIRHPVSSRVSIFAHGSGEIYGIDSSVSARNTQTQGRIEGGVQIRGGAAAIELVGGYERRIDADPIDFDAQRWVFAGFRILSR